MARPAAELAGMTSTVGEPTTAPTAAGGDARQRAGLTGLARGGLLGLIGSVASAGAGVLLVLTVTRTVPQDVAGTFFALTSVFLIAEVIARLGTGTGLVYAVSRARALSAAGRVPAFLRVALTPVLGLSILLGVAMFAGADRIAALVGAGAGGSTAEAVRILALLLPLTTISDTLVAATRGHGTMLPTVVLDRVGRPALQLGAVALVAATGSFALLTTAWAAPWVVTALLAGWWLLRLQRLHAAAAAAVRHDRRPWREFWAFTGPRALTSVVQLALQRLDIVLVTLLAGPAEAAIYTAATRFLVVGQTANQGLAGVVEPRLGRLLALGDRSAARAVYRTATGWLVLICWPLYLLAATYADSFLDWFGSGYDAGTVVVVILATTMLVATGIGMVDVVLIMGGRTTWSLANSVIALTVNIVLDLVLIPPLGVLGAAVGWAAAILVNNLLPLGQVWRHLQLHPFGTGTGVAMVLTMCCFGLVPLVSRIAWGSGNGTAALAATAVGGCLFALGCWRWRQLLALDTLRSFRRSARRPTLPAHPDQPDPAR